MFTAGISQDRETVLFGGHAAGSPYCSKRQVVAACGAILLYSRVRIRGLAPGAPTYRATFVDSLPPEYLEALADVAEASRGGLGN